MAAIAAVFGTLVAGPTGARGDTCPTISGGKTALRDVDAGLRLRFVNSVLARETRRARRWGIAWGVSLGVLGAGQLALGLEPEISPIDIDDGGQKSLYVGAAKSFLGAGSSVFTPLRIPHPRHVDSTEPCAVLAEAERALLAAARKERNQVLLGHIGSFVLSVGSILVLGVGYGYQKEAAFSVASGTAVGLLRTWTQPKGAIYALRRYRRGDLGGMRAEPEARAWTILPAVGPNGLLLVAAGAF